MNRQSNLQHFELFIDGRHVKPGSGEYSLDIDPATEEPIAAVALGSKAEVDVAVKAAPGRSESLGRHARRAWRGGVG